MEIAKRAIAGTLESSDIFLEVSPGAGGIEIELQSIVFRQYGDAIRQVIMEMLNEKGVTNARIQANDRGALDCVIRARVETALARAGKDGEE